MVHTVRKFTKSLAVAGLVATALTGTAGAANAAYADPPPSTTDWFGLTLFNNPAGNGGRMFQVCNWQSSANQVYVAVEDVTLAGARVELRAQDGWTTYGAAINFNSGSCDTFTILSGPVGDTLQGYITTPNFYGTGYVTYN